MSSTKPTSLIVSITFFFFCLLLQHSSAQTVVKGSYWFPESEFPVTDINSSHFTHLFCAFADLNSQNNQVTISSTNQPKFSTFTQTVQRRNPSVKTLMSIGGGIANKSAFASMASNPTSRKSFIDSSIRLARSNGFHGLDLDWEYPSSATEMNNFGTLLREWRSAVAAEASSTSRPRLLLAAAVFYSSDYYSVLYPVQAVASSLDWVNLMAYDFYGPGWSTVTGPPAALNSPSNAGPSGDAGVRAWIQAGLQATQLVLGFPYYGYAWRLSNANSPSYYAATTGSAISPDGSIGYGQIRKFIVDNGATTVYNSTVVGDYCYAGTTWIGYDDNQSIVTKVRYAKQKGLRGYFSWHVGADDNSGLSRSASRAWDATVVTTVIRRKF
ncbi:unnamed protein product [Brassica rapa]|uniref:GH18 domain-containing protein n=2 Tax=Brassica TaxID=3705 RepID=A0A3P6C8N7_BRACM|nr:class V chitinase-like [Brassica napus]CAF2235890.1 unnamed protein product [Brassica napus]CAG7897977.1 unnamed protein product [Brassica rapa]VDD04209.1 unnamed protein product [Brassica rapa]